MGFKYLCECNIVFWGDRREGGDRGGGYKKGEIEAGMINSCCSVACRQTCVHREVTFVHEIDTRLLAVSRLSHHFNLGRWRKKEKL